jgi:lipopolysaccharide biosynthesis glycosyltransferase
MKVQIEMIDVLPVERVLYLDADTLVRADIRPLWEMSLQGKPLAAAPDVGYPLGTHASDKAPYFNAGALLLDLALIRRETAALASSACSLRDSRFRDQDALNMHFQGRWRALPLMWNAQGLGSYAALPSADRDTLDLNAMNTPAVVHFTGPAHPSMNAVLNDWGQPYTAKPWGYAGAPGHPHAAEWWSMVEETAWKGYGASDAFNKLQDEEMTKAEKKGILCFKGRVMDSDV